MVLYLRRCISILAVLMIIFRAAFDARYAYQLPKRLSLMLPILAESAQKMLVLSFFIRGRVCLAISAGPIVLILNSF